MRSVRIPPRSLRRPNLSPVATTSDSHQTTKLDRYLQRLAHISQPGLLVLGLFGYFYTVVPVFQNQQLQEQTAKLELEKAAGERQLASLTAQQAKVREDIRVLQENWEKEKYRSARLATDVSMANNRESETRRQAAETETLLQRQLQILDKARWELVLLDFTFANFAPRYNSLVRSFNADSNKDFGTFIATAGDDWPQPYQTLLSAVETAEKKGTNRGEIPHSYYAELREFIKSNEPSLRCDKPNFEVMRDEYKAAIAALDPVIDAELEHKIDGIQKEYAEKGERVRITDDFRSKTRWSIRFGKVFSVENAFRDRLVAFRKVCDEKADRVVEKIRKEKGATR
ncbi:MAG: hypothetical protein HS110_04395 [Zoogloeaceae bacterium]|nr:hypothetical protein [Zoogloeaceae bacterium]